jgi:hypothetical protein
MTERLTRYPRWHEHPTAGGAASLGNMRAKRAVARRVLVAVPPPAVFLGQFERVERPVGRKRLDHVEMR